MNRVFRSIWPVITAAILCAALTNGAISQEPIGGHGGTNRNKPKPPPPPASAPSPETATATELWTLVLGTFADEGHEQAAQQMLANLPMVAPQITGARVYSTASGSMVIFGRYKGRDDPAAKNDQERIKAIRYQGRAVFNRVLLTHIDLRTAHSQFHPHDLLSARKQHPKVDPLYTLDIAIWIANMDPQAGQDRMTFEDAKKKAEAYAAQLRMTGEQAYFYHDPKKQQSMVTVGLFDHRAIHPVSRMYSDEVESLLKKHPVRLANGEPLMEFKNPKKPRDGTRPQVPKLVLVPTL